MTPDALSRDRAARLRTPRQVKLVVTALAIISLSAAGLFALSLFPNVLAALSGIVTDHPGYIRATNALVAALCCVFLLWPREGSRLVGRWSEYVGWAFFILFIQYAIRLAALFAGAVVQPEWEPAIKFSSDFLIYPASFLNNILFLMAARILLNKSKELRAMSPPADCGVLDRVRYFLAGLQAGLPKWVWWMFLFTLLALLDNEVLWARYPDYIVWVRFPDAFFSIFCLSWFAYAVLLSLQVRRHTLLAWVSFVLVLLYGAGQLIYALNPVIAYTLLDRPTSQSALTKRLKASLWPNIDKVIFQDFQDFKPSDFEEPDKLLNRITSPDDKDAVAVYLHDHPITHAFQKGGPNWPASFTLGGKQEALADEMNAHLSEKLDSQDWVKNKTFTLTDETRALLEQGPTTDEGRRRLNRLLLEDAFDPSIKKMTTRDFLDGAIFALLFPMKYLLFMPAFILYLLSVISVNSFRRALHKTTKSRKDYLSEDGILDVIGKSLDADEVKLLIRLPGMIRRHGAREERYLRMFWSATKKYTGKVERKAFPISKSRLLTRVMQTEGKEIVLTNEDEGEEAADLRARGNLPQTLVLIPIRFHGGVIGVLRAVFSGYGKFNDGTLEQLKFMAELVAPSVQDFRTMSAVDKFGMRLHRGKSGDLSKGQESPRAPNGAGDFNTAMDELMAMLFDLLNPLCVSLLIECGFKSSRPAYPCDGPYHDILQEHGAVYGRKRTGHFETENGPVDVFEDYLPSSTGKSEQLGKLILIIPHEKDEFNKPTLAAYYLTRLMIASLVANGIVNAARASLSIIIHDLGPAFNKETLSYEQWFAEVSAAARKAGLLWVVASVVGDSQPFRGRLEYVEIVKGLTPEDNDALQRAPLSCVPHKDLASVTRHIVHLKLGDGCSLWLGVGREGFGSELTFNSPWREFLEKLAGIAQVALKSIDDRLRNKAERRREEEAKLRAAKEATEREWVEKNNLFRVLTFHDLIHLVRVLDDTASAALEAASNGAAGSQDQIRKSIRTILNFTKKTQDLIRVISKLTQWDEPSDCSIVKAVDQARRLVQHPLELKGIKVQHNIRPEAVPLAVAALPLGVGTLVIANLLRNAVEASHKDGTITIHTEVANGAVSCNVLNGGKPVPDDVRKKLGDQPLPTADDDNGYGWGLFVIPRLLQKFDGEFHLSYSDESGTCFTLRLPIAKY
jgi:signal transduction histidine kinase